MPPHRRPELRELLQQLLGPGYELQHELTGAGMSRVFVARELSLDRQVVVKVLPPELVTDAGLARFRREVQVTARLQHPHILPVLSTGGEGDLRYYVAPYVASESLRRHLARGNRLPVEQALAIALELLGAIALAHSHGIIHCDIKPGNVLLSGSHAILADFGIARALHEHDDAHDLMGSSMMDHAAYSPPGHARDAAADLWAIAVLTHEAITGSTPALPALPDRMVAEWAAADPGVDPQSAALPAAVIARALHQDPDARFPSAEAFAEALRRAVRATGAFTAIAPPRALHTRRRAVAWIALALGLAGAGAIAVARGRDDAAAAEPPAERVMRVQLLEGTDSVARAAAAQLDQLLASALRDVSALAVVTSGTADTSALPSWATLDGRVLAAGPLLRVELELRRPYADSQLVRVSATAPADSIDALANRLAIAILPRLYTTLDPPPGAAILDGTSHPDALRHFLDGEVARARAASDSAYLHFRAATEADPRFAMAWYRRAESAEQSVRVLDADSASMVALALAPTLPLRERLLVEGYAAFRAGDARAAEATYQRLLQADWRNPDAWRQLGEIGYHMGPLLGRSIDASRDAWSQLLSIDSSDVGAVTHLIRLVAREGDPRPVRALLERLDADSARGVSAEESRIVAVYATGSEADRRAADASLDTLPDYSLYFLHATVAGLLERPDLARGIARRLVAPHRPTTVRAQGHVALAHLAIAEGRRDEAWHELDLAASLDPSAAALARASLAALPFVAVPRAAQDSAARALREAPDPNATPLSLELVADLPAMPVIRAYLGALLQPGGEGSLACAARAPASRQLCDDLVLELEAERQVARGRNTEALVAVERMGMIVPYQLAARSTFFARTRARWRRAELLDAAHWDREARDWYVTTPQGSRLDYVYLAASRLRRGLLRERANDPVGAAEHYRKVIALLARANGEFVPLRREAEAGLRRVQSS